MPRSRWREPGGHALEAPNVCGSDFACTKPDRRRFDFRLGPGPGRKRPSSSGIQGSSRPGRRRSRWGSRCRHRCRRRGFRRRFGRHYGFRLLLGGFLRSFFLGGPRGRLFLCRLLLARSLLLRRLSGYYPASSSLLLLGLLGRFFLRSFLRFALRCHAHTPSRVDERCRLLHPALPAGVSGGRRKPRPPNPRCRTREFGFDNARVTGAGTVHPRATSDERLDRRRMRRCADRRRSALTPN